jgi:gliding motility-associated-like protein
VSICYGDTVQLQAAGADTYEWSPASSLSDPFVSNPLAFPTQTTTYYVLMRDRAGCEYRDSVRVTVLPFEPVSIEVETLPSCAATNGIRLKAVGGLESYTYEWHMGDGTVLEGATPEVYFYTKGGTYDVVLLVNTGDCIAKLKQQVQIEEKPLPPNVITPNGDGINDVLVLPEAGSRLRVVNRWGKTVYESTDYRNDWGGDSLPSGVYFFHVVTPSGRDCRGWLHLLR